MVGAADVLDHDHDDGAGRSCARVANRQPGRSGTANGRGRG